MTANGLDHGLPSRVDQAEEEQARNVDVSQYLGEQLIGKVVQLFADSVAKSDLKEERCQFGIRRNMDDSACLNGNIKVI